jgi:hypothetical protein
MIGVVYKSHEEAAVRELFELFKTPWEPYDRSHHYDVLLSTSQDLPANTPAKLIVIYGSEFTRNDSPARRLEKESADECTWLQGDGFDVPVYGQVSTLARSEDAFLRLKSSGECVGDDLKDGSQQTIRIGYNLFEEVAFLLSKGQPPRNAAIPTLEIHISILRECVRNAGISFLEVLPTPYGYDFTASLTHDVDFVGIRDHKLDQTMWGFLYRASIGALVSLAKGRSTWSRCVENWKAVASLPLVYLGLCEDFWIEFDRFSEMESGLSPTYFFIPFRDEPGTWNDRPAPSRRAAKYDVGQLREPIRKLAQEGCGIGLHGLNAWRDSASAKLESKRISEVFEQSERGVRMHWLYMTEQSPKVLEDAGFAYDSTYGYNEAVGFRAGTAQAFCPIGAPGLTELPLIIQDTAMFYPNRMNLSEGEALDRCIEVIRAIVRYGGALTINWHTRSLSPERLWGEFYKELLARIKQSKVWFCTAGMNAKWFRSRRAVRFEEGSNEDEVRLTLDDPLSPDAPPLRVRVYGGERSRHLDIHDQDIAWRGSTDLSVSLAQQAEI